MRWYTWNTVAKTDGKGNVSYEKQEARSRKTDGFMAYVAAMTQDEKLKGERAKINKKILTIVG